MLLQEAKKLKKKIWVAARAKVLKGAKIVLKSLKLLKIKEQKLFEKGTEKLPGMVFPVWFLRPFSQPKKTIPYHTMVWYGKYRAGMESSAAGEMAFMRAAAPARFIGKGETAQLGRRRSMSARTLVRALFRPFFLFAFLDLGVQLAVGIVAPKLKFSNVASEILTSLSEK